MDFDDDIGVLAFVEKRKDFEGKDVDDDDSPESKKLTYIPFTDRYFKKYYKLDIKKPFNDHLVYLHSNHVAICTVAPSHPVLDKNKYKIESIVFLQGISENMKGKHKQNAKILHVMQPFCHILAKNIQNDPPIDEKFTIYSLINAKLIEINEKIVKNPQLFQDLSQTDGYLIILFPKHNNIKEQFAPLIPHAEYVKLIADRNNVPPAVDINTIERNNECLVDNNNDVQNNENID